VRSVQLDLTIPGRAPAEVYATLADFARYPDYAPAVRHVTITQSDGQVSVSRWEVNFRRGVLRWVEEDTFDPVALVIAFRQLEGDIDVFEGSWSCTQSAEGTAVVFAARLDMGIPSLADALEPIAARTLVDNTVAIVSGLFEGRSVVEHVSVDGAADAVVAGVAS
jgi:ribosome-associated toxin RatA of RatAB toxin-antitoxin module